MIHNKKIVKKKNEIALNSTIIVVQIHMYAHTNAVEVPLWEKIRKSTTFVVHMLLLLNSFISVFKTNKHFSLFLDEYLQTSSHVVRRKT